MILAGLGGVLIAPLFQLQDFMFTLVVLGSLAAVVLGGLRSIPIAFVGGLLLGVVQNLVAGYSDDILPKFLSDLSGLRSSVPYLLVIVLLLFIGRDRSRRARIGGRRRPPPDHRDGLSKLRRRLPWAIWTLILIAFSFGWFGWDWLHADAYDQTVIAQSLVMGIIFLSFVVVTGMSGQVSLMQASFVTAGGFAAGWALTHDFGVDIPGIAAHGQLNFFWAVVIAGLAAAALGALLALPLTRLGGVNFALGTLAWAFFLALGALHDRRHPQRPERVVDPRPVARHPRRQLGERLPRAQVEWTGDVAHLPKLDFTLLQEQILLFLVVFGLLTLVIHAVKHSASGRAALAVRSSEVAAEASGIRVNRSKVMIFALSAAIAGIGGALLGMYSFAFTDTTAPVLPGLIWLALAVTFGIRRPGGALLAGFALAGGTAIFHWIASWSFLSGGDVNALITSIYFVPILSGLGAIQLAQEPDGILSLAGQQKLRKKREKARLARIAAVEAETHGGVVPEHELVRATDSLPPSDAAAMQARPSPLSDDDVAAAAFAVRGIVAGYGDAEVLHGVDLQVERGKVIALLGANGAGKSTLCSVAAGIVEPSMGTVYLDGADITQTEPFRRARAGVLLVPEARGIFPGLTVEENLTVLLRDDALRKDAYERFPILSDRRKQVAGLLSGGEQQMLSLAPALADPPVVLIADEPTLGLAPLAADAVMDAILELRDRGCAVLLVEEHAQNALRVADTLAFMELGNIVWTVHATTPTCVSSPAPTSAAAPEPRGKGYAATREGSSLPGRPTVPVGTSEQVPDRRGPPGDAVAHVDGASTIFPVDRGRARPAGLGTCAVRTRSLTTVAPPIGSPGHLRVPPVLPGGRVDRHHLAVLRTDRTAEVRGLVGFERGRRVERGDVDDAVGRGRWREHAAVRPRHHVGRSGQRREVMVLVHPDRRLPEELAGRRVHAEHLAALARADRRPGAPAPPVPVFAIKACTKS